MKQDAWIKKQLQEIEGIQRLILGQQTRIEDTFVAVRKESAMVLKKIRELENLPDNGDVFISEELERVINVISVRAKTIDEKVSDTPVCASERTTKKKKGK